MYFYFLPSFHYTKTELCLEHLLAQEKEVPIFVDTLPQAEQSLKRLDTLESSAQVGLAPIDFL